VVGAAAFTGAVTHTVSTIVIVSEMTGQVRRQYQFSSLAFPIVKVHPFLFYFESSSASFVSCGVRDRTKE
jgi:hypothetical protein